MQQMSSGLGIESATPWKPYLCGGAHVVCALTSRPPDAPRMTLLCREKVGIRLGTINTQWGWSLMGFGLGVSVRDSGNNYSRGGWSLMSFGVLKSGRYAPLSCVVKFVNCTPIIPFKSKFQKIITMDRKEMKTIQYRGGIHRERNLISDPSIIF